MTQQLPLTDEESAPVTVEKPKRIGLFRNGTAYGALAAMGAGAAGIALGSLGLELLMARMLHEGYAGTMLGLPFPLVSMPLGLGALILTALTALKAPQHVPIPLLCTALYWGAAAALLFT